MLPLQIHKYLRIRFVNDVKELRVAAIAAALAGPILAPLQSKDPIKKGVAYPYKLHLLSMISRWKGQQNDQRKETAS